MSKHTRDTQTDIRAAVDAISSHFSTDGSSAVEAHDHGKGTARESRVNHTTNTDEPPTNDPFDTYLSFSDTHRGSNHIMLGVITFFVLVAGVWGFLWYQSLVNMNIADSFTYDILSEQTDDLSTMFQELVATSDAEAARAEEIVLKTDLATALRKEYAGSAVLGTTTTDISTTPTITE